jgi:integrase/recombinase XerD
MADLETGVEEYLFSLTVERGLSPNTLAAYQRDLAQYLEFLDGKAPYTEDLDRFVAHLHRRGLAATSVVRKLAAVRGLHRFLVIEGRTREDPTRLLDHPRPPDPFPKALSVHQAIALVESPDSTTRAGRRDRALLEFLYASGARVSEAVALNLSDLDLEERTAVLTGKGDKQRLVPIGTKAVETILAWLPDRIELTRRRKDADAVFLNLRGSRISRQSVFRIVRLYAAKVGITPESVSPHTLRHSTATHMVEGGADLRSVQVMLGHARITTTQVYTRVSPQHLVEVFLLSHPRSQ